MMSTKKTKRELMAVLQSLSYLLLLESHYTPQMRNSYNEALKYVKKEVKNLKRV